MLFILFSGSRLLFANIFLEFEGILYFSCCSWLKTKSPTLCSTEKLFILSLLLRAVFWGYKVLASLYFLPVLYRWSFMVLCSLLLLMRSLLSLIPFLCLISLVLYKISLSLSLFFFPLAIWKMCLRMVFTGFILLNVFWILWFSQLFYFIGFGTGGAVWLWILHLILIPSHSEISNLQVRLLYFLFHTHCPSVNPLPILTYVLVWIFPIGLFYVS